MSQSVDGMSRLAALSLTAVICGFGMMALEILGGRFLQPAFGSSIDVWAAVICVFILSLSIGYVLGGRLADRTRGSATVGLIIAAASLFYLLLPVYGRPLLDALGSGVHSARWGSLLAAALLFLPPSVLLGCVSPMLVTLARPPLARVGETTGLLYGAGCLGNVLGVLIADYVLLVVAPLNRNLLGTGLLLGATGCWHILQPLGGVSPRRTRGKGRSAGAVLLAALLVCAGVGWAFQRPSYRIGSPGLPADETVLDHRDSPYAHISWIVSQSANYAQLRFFDKSQGAVCLRPRWDEYARLDPALAHVAMPEGAAELRRRAVNPGTLVNALYVCLYPAGALLNERLMAQAGWQPRAIQPDVLMAGLGSGAGVVIFAHHFPQASLTVIDLDPAVVALVRRHYPLIAWLETQRTADARPRLRIVTGDARQAVREAARQGRRYDTIVLDAFGLGSTIPPHLLTREWFHEIGRVLAEDGIVVANIPGSYAGVRRQLLAGALRSARAGGFTSLLNIPVLLPEEDEQGFDRAIARSNIVLASRTAIDRSSRPEAWRRLERFTLYPELPTRRFVSRFISLTDGDRYLSAKVPLEQAGVALDRELAEELRRRIAAQRRRPEGLGERLLVERPDLVRGAVEVVRRRTAGRLPAGWAHPEAAKAIVYEEIDNVAFIREMFQGGLRVAILVGQATDPAAGVAHPGGAGTTASALPPARPDPSARRAHLWDVTDVPLFTDDQPNADLYDR